MMATIIPAKDVGKQAVLDAFSKQMFCDTRKEQDAT